MYRFFFYKRYFLINICAMLLRFVVSNFLSFAEEVEFNMFPGNFKIHKDHIYHTPEVDLLKTAAIYGANGSGKSNFVKAVNFLRDIVTEGTINLTDYNRSIFKLDETFKNKPTTLEVEFKRENRYFSYGVSILNETIEKEWLHRSFPSKSKNEMIFERETTGEKTTVKVNENLLTSDKERLRYEIYAEETSPTTSFISKIKDKVNEAGATHDWFSSFVWLIFPHTKHRATLQLSKEPDYKKYVNTILPKLGTGLTKIETRRFPFEEIRKQMDEESWKAIEKFDEILGADDDAVEIAPDSIVHKEDGKIYLEKMVLLNKGKNEDLIEFNFDEQSDGTQRIIDLIPALRVLEDEEAIFVVDEIERSLHPSLIKEFLDLFLSKPSKGQLIFTTHESYLLDLDLFRQDEIWFTEKSKEGATSMYSLSEFKPRYDLDIRKGYLAGRFGAIPFLGNLKELNWHHAEEQGI